MTHAIEFIGLTKKFGATTAVDAINLTVPSGSFVVLLGPSGCGKTTTLRMLAGLEAPTGGKILIGAETIADAEIGLSRAPGKRGAGMVFQSYALWPHMTVRQNIEWPLKIARWDRDTRRERITEVLQMLQIEELAGRYPSEISGGQQQRVAIARTIAPKPQVLLFDEPLSNLDAKLRVDTRGELIQIHRVTGTTSMYVTHDQVEAMTMATHVALMRDGRIEQFGTPDDLLFRPATTFVATFIGTPPANVLPAVADRGRLFVESQEVGHHPGAEGPVSVMYRAENLSLAPDGEPTNRPNVAMVFQETTLLAGRFLSSGKVGATRVNVITDTSPHLEYGRGVSIVLPAQPDAVFGQDGHRLGDIA